MQKKLIALAVAGLISGAASAQVSMYGVLDVGVFSASGKTAGATNKFNGVNGGNLSGNRLGFTAAEDLGDGLKAIGRFEFGSLNIDGLKKADGTAQTDGIDGTRQSFAGLSSATLGTLVVGRLQTPGYDAGFKHDAFGAANFGPYATLASQVAKATTINSAARVDNAVGYASPSLSGAVIKATLARNGNEMNSGSSSTSNVMALSAEYTRGPLDVSGVLTTVSQSDKKDRTEMLLGANYNLGVAKLMASYIRTTGKVPGKSDVKGGMAQLGAQIPVAKGTIKVAFGVADTDAVADQATTFGLDYEHAFGKRTTGYVGLNMTKVGDHNADVKVVNAVAGADKTITAVGVGGRLTF